MAIAARNLKHAQEYAKQHNIPKAFGSYEELAEDPDVGKDGGWREHGEGEKRVVMVKRVKVFWKGPDLKL